MADPAPAPASASDPSCPGFALTALHPTRSSHASSHPNPAFETSIGSLPIPDHYSQLMASPASSPSPQPSSTPNNRLSSSSTSSHRHHQLSTPLTDLTSIDDDTRVKLDISPSDSRVRNEVLNEAFFPDWQSNAVTAEFDDPAEMQKQDPLAVQVWKTYSRQKMRMPNQERMANLTWRMMAMNLKKKEAEQAR